MVYNFPPFKIALFRQEKVVKNKIKNSKIDAPYRMITEKYVYIVPYDYCQME